MSKKSKIHVFCSEFEDGGILTDDKLFAEFELLAPWHPCDNGDAGYRGTIDEIMKIADWLLDRHISHSVG